MRSPFRIWLAYATLRPVSFEMVVGDGAAWEGLLMASYLPLANFVCNRKVSHGQHDPPALAAHNGRMSKRAPQRWFLKQWRKHRGYTQERLAEMTNLSKPYISQLESGVRQFTHETLVVLAEALSCDPADLIMRDPSEPDGIWSVWETLSGPQRRQVVEIAKTLKKTGTGD